MVQREVPLKYWVLASAGEHNQDQTVLVWVAANEAYPFFVFNYALVCLHDECERVALWGSCSDSIFNCHCGHVT
jgi:hypothetical protein